MSFCPKSSAIFATQIIVVLVVVLSAIINLSLNKDEHTEMWISLLCSSIGYVLPSPKLRKLTENQQPPTSED